MKKFILTFLFISVSSLLLTAQITIKPGGGFQYLDYSRSTNNWDRFGGIGYQLGSTVKIGRQFYFEPGVFWMANISEFSQIEGDNGNGPIRLDHQLNTLRMPLLAGYNFWDSQGTSVDFNVVLGPVLNFIVGVENSIPNTSAPAKDDYNAVFWGGNLGLNIAYWWLFLDVGYEMGFSKLYKDTDQFGSAKANIFYLNIGIRIRL